MGKYVYQTERVRNKGWVLSAFEVNKGSGHYLRKYDMWGCKGHKCDNLVFFPQYVYASMNRCVLHIHYDIKMLHCEKLNAS